MIGVVEGRVEREPGTVFPLVEALEDQALVVGHGRVPVPFMFLRVAQRVRLARAVREAQFIFELLARIDRRLVADGERAPRDGVFCVDTSPDVDERVPAVG